MATKKPRKSTDDPRQRINIGPTFGQVSPVAYWWKHGQFKSEEEARGAFRLAYQQGMDGMGPSVREWMGLTEKQFDAWMRSDELPPRPKR